MLTARAKPKRSLRNRAHARGAIVRTDRRRLCAEISTNCRTDQKPKHRSCARLGIISKDPIGFNAGDANLYRYVGNTPTTHTDPSGLESPTRPPSLINPNGPPNNQVPGNPPYSPQVPVGTLGPPPILVQPTNTPPVSTFVRPERGMVGNSLLAGYIGLAEAGRYVTYPARWLGADFSEHDQCLDQLWDETGIGSNSWTRTGSKAGGFVFAAGAYSAAAVGVATLATGETMAISVTQFHGNNFHIAYQVGGRWFHAIGRGAPLNVVRWGRATKFGAGGYWRTLSGIPIRNPSAAAQTGQQVSSCASAALQALKNGWTGVLVPVAAGAQMTNERYDSDYSIGPLEGAVR